MFHILINKHTQHIEHNQLIWGRLALPLLHVLNYKLYACSSPLAFAATCTHNKVNVINGYEALLHVTLACAGWQIINDSPGVICMSHILINKRTQQTEHNQLIWGRLAFPVMHVLHYKLYAGSSLQQAHTSPVGSQLLKPCVGWSSCVGYKNITHVLFQSALARARAVHLRYGPRPLHTHDRPNTRPYGESHGYITAASVRLYSKRSLLNDGE